MPQDIKVISGYFQPNHRRITLVINNFTEYTHQNNVLRIVALTILECRTSHCCQHMVEISLTYCCWVATDLCQLTYVLHTINTRV